MHVHVGVHWLKEIGEFHQFCGFQLDDVQHCDHQLTNHRIDWDAAKRLTANTIMAPSTNNTIHLTIMTSAEAGKMSATNNVNSSFQNYPRQDNQTIIIVCDVYTSYLLILIDLSPHLLMSCVLGACPLLPYKVTNT